MKGLPPIVWILGCFVLGAIVTFAYSRTGPKLITPAESVWYHAESFRDSLRLRQETLAEGEKREFSQQPYHAELSRLENLTEPIPMARYVARIRPEGYLPRKNTWVGDGVDVAMIDYEPSGAVGNVRIVAIRKITKEEW